MPRQVCNFTTYLTATTLGINAVCIFRAILAQMSLLFADKAARKVCTAIFNGLRALGKGMPRFTTVIAEFLQIPITFVRAVLHTMPSLPAEQANLVLVPIGLLGAVLGCVVGALADEALLPGPHPGNPQRVLRPPRSSYSAAGSRLLHLLEHALLALLLLAAVGRRGGRGRTEAGVRLAEALPRLPLTLVRHRLLRPPHSLALLFAAAVAVAAAEGKGEEEGRGRENGRLPRVARGLF